MNVISSVMLMSSALFVGFGGWLLLVSVRDVRLGQCWWSQPVAGHPDRLLCTGVSLLLSALMAHALISGRLPPMVVQWVTVGLCVVALSLEATAWRRTARATRPSTDAQPAVPRDYRQDDGCSASSTNARRQRSTRNR